MELGVQENETVPSVPVMKISRCWGLGSRTGSSTCLNIVLRDRGLGDLYFVNIKY